MVDTQTLGWSVGFGLTALELEELDNSSHSLDMKPYSTLDYTNLSGMEYDPSLPQGDYTHTDLTHMYSYRQQESQSECPELFRVTILFIAQSSLWTRYWQK